jgi:hypothetical protein
VSEYTHTGLNLVGIHEPETSIDPVGPGEYTKRELPGFYTIGTEIEGVFVPLARLKAGKLLQDIERAKKSKGTEQTPNG